MQNGAAKRSQAIGSLPFHPAFGGRTLYTIEQRPPGDNDEANTGQTCDLMARYAREDSPHPIVRAAAYEAIRGAHGSRKEAEAIHAWIRAHVRFTDDAELAEGVSNDPLEAEVLVRPVDLLTMPEPQGDCDDFSMLAAAMLRAVGIRSSFKTVAVDPASDRYSHVYVMADVAGGPLAIDASHGPYPGWEVETRGKSRLWPVEENMSLRRNLGDLIGEGTVPIDATDPTGGYIWTGGGGSSLPDLPGTSVPSSPGFNWGGLVTALSNDAAKILGTRYAVPQLNPGQSIATGPNGTVMSQLPNGVMPAVTTGLNTGMLLLIGAGIIAVVMLTTRK